MIPRAQSMKRALVADDKARGRELPDAVKSAVSVLIIDDNSGSLELLSKALAQPGLEAKFSSVEELVAVQF
jgi:hypothetical protein